MHGFILGLIILTLCGCQSLSPPRHPENLCAVFTEKSRWREPAADAQLRWSITAPVLMATMFHESSFRHDAKPPKRYLLGFIPWGRLSDAYGYAQATDATWAEYVDQQNRWFAARDDFDDAIDFIGWYHHRSASSLGISRQDARNLYLAYHEGRGGYARKSYLAKPWLMRYSEKVVATAERYQRQLASCRVWPP